MQITYEENDEHQEGKCCFSGPNWGWKRAKNHVQHKIEGFCDQSIVNNVLHHIIILLKNNITNVPLDASVTTPFLTFEFTKMVNSTCLELKKKQKKNLA